MRLEVRLHLLLRGVAERDIEDDRLGDYGRLTPFSAWPTVGHCGPVCEPLVALCPLPDWSSHAVTWFEVHVTPLSAVSQSGGRPARVGADTRSHESKGARAHCLPRPHAPPAPRYHGSEVSGRPAPFDSRWPLGLT